MICAKKILRISLLFLNAVMILAGFKLTVIAEDGDNSGADNSDDSSASGGGNTANTETNTGDAGGNTADAVANTDGSAADSKSSANSANGSEKINENIKSKIHTEIDKLLKINSFVSAMPKDTKAQSAARAKVLESEIDKLRSDVSSLLKALEKYSGSSNKIIGNEVPSVDDKNKKHHKSQNSDEKNGTKTKQSGYSKKSKSTYRNRSGKESKYVKGIYTVKHVRPSDLKNSYANGIREIYAVSGISSGPHIKSFGGRSTAKYINNAPTSYQIKSYASLNTPSMQIRPANQKSSFQKSKYFGTDCGCGKACQK